MDREFLEKLLYTPSPSGDEGPGLEVWRDKIGKNLGLIESWKDKSGNSGYQLGHGSVKVLLSAHIDEIAMSVGNIDNSGTIIPKKMAGIDQKVLPGSEVLVATGWEARNYIGGIIGKKPIHVETPEERNSLTRFSDLRIDIGARNRKEVENDFDVHIGSPIVLGRSINLEFGKNRLYGNALDDKSGIFIISEVISKLLHDPRDSWKEKYSIIVMACTGEESGLLGSHRAAHIINPDISIDLDVTPSSDLGQLKDEVIRLGRGPVIEFGQDKSRRINNCLRNICEAKKIPYQCHVSKIGGTNTKSFFLESRNSETTLISLPLLSMHTAVESMHWKDIEWTIDLLEEVIVSQNL